MSRHAVTGAIGFTGRHIAQRLLDAGDEVLNLTSHPNRPDPFGGRVPFAPLAFDDPATLRRGLEGIDTLYNTYWVRLARGRMTHELAARHCETLFREAASAGVRRIVHISIANADPASRLPYYRAKGRAEAALRETGLSHAILRPAVIVGDEPILVNNIAWLLRHLPVFGVAGDGAYPIQPVHVDDLARLAAEAAAQTADVEWDAGGPETYPFISFMKTVRRAIGSHALLVPMPPALTLAAATVVGLGLRDVVLTADEQAALTSGLMATHEPPRATIRFSDWLADAASWLGRSYISELKRHWT